MDPHPDPTPQPDPADEPPETDDDEALDLYSYYDLPPEVIDAIEVTGMDTY